MKTNAEPSTDCYADVIKLAINKINELGIEAYKACKERDDEIARLKAESGIDQRNAAMSQQESCDLLDKAESLRSTIIYLIDTLTMHRIEDKGAYAMVDTVELNQAVERARKALTRWMPIPEIKE